MHRLPALAALLLLSTFAAPAHAVLITGTVRGTVRSNFTDRHPFGPPVVNLRFFVPGEAFELTYSFDTAQAILENSTPTGAGYTVRNIQFQITAAGGYRFEGRGLDTRQSQAFLGVLDGPTDRVVMRIGGASGHALVTFTDPSGLALSSTALPTSAEMARFGRVDVEFGRERNVHFEGFHGSGVAVAVATPEPSTLAMGLVGVVLATAGWARRRSPRRISHGPAD